MPYVTDPGGLDAVRPNGCGKLSLVAERVLALVTEAGGFPPGSITPTTHFVYDIGADSIDEVELLMRLEEEFGIRIPGEDAEGLQTVGRVIAYFERRIAEVP